MNHWHKHSGYWLVWSHYWFYSRYWSFLSLENTIKPINQ